MIDDSAGQMGEIAGKSIDYAPNDVEPVSESELADSSAILDLLKSTAAEHRENAVSRRTRELYAKDWEHFVSWCRRAQLQALPSAVETIMLYLADMSLQIDQTGKPRFTSSTMERRLSAVSRYHRDHGHASPTRDSQVRDVINGIERKRKHRVRRMRPLLLDDIKTILADLDYSTWPEGVSATRDAFVLLAGFAGALRRSELADLTADRVTWHPHDGLHVFLPESKTDQTGKGANIALPYGRYPQTCVVCAWVRWLTLVNACDQGRPQAMKVVRSTPSWTHWQHVCRSGAPERPEGSPLLRGILRGGRLSDAPVTGDALHAMIKRRASAVGFTQDIGFHSLRAGFVTQARRNGADPRAIRRQTRHGSDAMVDVYDREYVPLVGNAVTELGL